MLYAKLAAITGLLFASGVSANGCHTGDDSIGKYCQFFSAETFGVGVDDWCKKNYNTAVMQGQSFGLKTGPWADGAGGKQIFWGNYRVDRGGYTVINYNECHDTMMGIFADCGGYGGWRDTGFGTIFAECIRI